MPDDILDPRDLEDFQRLDGALRTMAPPAELPDGLRERTLQAVAVAATGAPRARSQRLPGGRRRSRLALGGGMAAAAAAAVVLALVLASGSGQDGPPVELRATLQAPDRPGVTAAAEVVNTGIGREIALRTDALPILPTSEYYELWFVGPGDTPSTPNRISAGTFHPDAQGRSNVDFTAAVDPAKYPVLSVTAEPGDGDPRPSGTEVLRSRTE